MKISLKQLLAKLPRTEYGAELTLASLMGLAAGVAALLLEDLVGAIGTLRLHLLALAPALIVLPSLGAAGGFVSGLLVEKCAPTASGSGIPQVRAFLLGKAVPLDWPVVFVKLFGGSLSLGSGLFSGREGPTVHAGAAIAMQLSNLLSISAKQARQLVAAGAGAGLAAAFNAPLAGVLFVAEELLKDVSVATMRMALTACFVSSVTTRLLEAPHLEANRQAEAIQISFVWQDILFWLLLGVLCGVLGTLFSKSVVWCCGFNRDKLKLPLSCRVALAGLLCGLAVAALMPEHRFENYAALKSLFASTRMDIDSLLVAFCTFFVLSVAVYGSGAPGGLFAPTLVLGSSLGALVAHLETVMFGVGSVEMMALVGMGGMFAAVARVPLTALVIIVEMTGHYHLMLPLMITIATAVMVASRMEPKSVYELLREFAGLGGDEPETPSLSPVLVRQVMSSQFVLVEDHAGCSGLPALLSSHQSVVVIKDGQPVGIVSANRVLERAVLADDAGLGDLSLPLMSISADDKLEHAIQILKEGAESVLVLENGQVVGVVTCESVMGAGQVTLR